MNGMRIGAVIITHGSIAESIREAAETITGAAADIRTVTVGKTDTSESLRKALGEAVDGADSGQGVIVFTDMFGGTPTNIAISFLKEGRVEVITGVNLPLILKFLSHRAEKPLSEAAALLRDYGRTSVVLAADMLREKK